VDANLTCGYRDFTILVSYRRGATYLLTRTLSDGANRTLSDGSTRTIYLSSGVSAVNLNCGYRDFTVLI